MVVSFAAHRAQRLPSRVDRLTVGLFKWEDWDLIAIILLEYHGSFRRRFVELGFPLLY